MTVLTSTRRGFLTALGATAMSQSGWAADYCRDEVAAGAVAAKGTPPLGRASERVAWGVALDAPAVLDPALVQALTAEAPRFLAIANGLKFGNLFPEPFTPHDGKAVAANWGECDDIVSLASKLRVPIRGDCLAWNDWIPAWVTAQAKDPSNAQRALLQNCFEAQFAAVFSHFAAVSRAGGPAMRWCGVVNEPFNPWVARGGVPSWRTGAWLDVFGTATDGVPSYIHQAFALGARLRTSNETALFLNEANCENDHFGPLLRPAMLRLVDALQKAGRRVDAVGFECHLVPQWMRTPEAPDWTNFVDFLKDLSRREVKILITELDVIDCAFRGTATRDAIVARYMSSLVEAALAVPAVEMVTNWDFSDRYSWLRGDGVYPSLGSWASCVAHPECPRPDLYDQALQPKSARDALAQALESASK